MNKDLEKRIELINIQGLGFVCESCIGLADVCMRKVGKFWDDMKALSFDKGKTELYCLRCYDEKKRKLNDSIACFKTDLLRMSKKVAQKAVDCKEII